MRIHQGFLGWGVFLVLAGAVPLAVRAGYLTEDQVRNVVDLWPLILVGIGVGLVLARTRAAFLGGLIVFATFGTMVGGLLATGVPWLSGGACGGEPGAVAFPTSRGSFAGPSAQVDVELNCGRLDVTTAAGLEWRIEGSDRDGSGPVVEADDTSLVVRPANGDHRGFPFTDAGSSWRLTLPEATRLEFQLVVNAAEARLDLAGADIESLRLTTNAASTTIELGARSDGTDLRVDVNAGAVNLTLPNGTFVGSLDVNAGSVSICTPPGMPLRFDTSGSTISGFNFSEQGLVRSGDAWETPGFGTGSSRTDLRANVNAGSITLNPEDGCDG